jgi:hypothetical protein
MGRAKKKAKVQKREEQQENEEKIYEVGELLLT